MGLITSEQLTHRVSEDAGMPASGSRLSSPRTPFLPIVCCTSCPPAAARTGESFCLEELADLHKDLLNILRRPGVLLATSCAGDLRQTARVSIAAIGDGENLHRVARIFA
jgi:hypothetical protein